MSATTRLGSVERALSAKNDSLRRENERLQEKLNAKGPISNTAKFAIGVLAVATGVTAGYLIGSPTAVATITASIGNGYTYVGACAAGVYSSIANIFSSNVGGNREGGPTGPTGPTGSGPTGSTSSTGPTGQTGGSTGPSGPTGA